MAASEKLINQPYMFVRVNGQRWVSLHLTGPTGSDKLDPHLLESQLTAFLSLCVVLTVISATVKYAIMLRNR